MPTAKNTRAASRLNAPFTGWPVVKNSQVRKANTSTSSPSTMPRMGGQSSWTTSSRISPTISIKVSIAPALLPRRGGGSQLVDLVDELPHDVAPQHADLL